MDPLAKFWGCAGMPHVCLQPRGSGGWLSGIKPVNLFYNLVKFSQNTHPKKLF